MGRIARWTRVQEVQAWPDGWNLFNNTIRREPDVLRFRDDFEALQHVRSLAASGAPLAKQALRLHLLHAQKKLRTSKSGPSMVLR